MAGKGDKPRPINHRAYREHYEAIFRRPKEPDEVAAGEIVDGKLHLGNGAWMATNPFEVEDYDEG